MENKDPSGKGAAKQEAAGEEYKKEAEQLLKLHRQDKVFAPTAFFGIVSAYLLFVGAVTGVGMLASYSHHETTANVFLIVSIPLLFIAPIGVIWYLLVSFRKEPSEKDIPKKENLLERFARSAAGRALGRIGNNRFVRIAQYAVYTLPIVSAIRDWPRDPRSSLAVIVAFLAFIFLFALWDVARWCDGLLARRNKEVWDFNNKLVDAIFYIANGFKENNDNITASMAAIQEDHQLTRKMVYDLVDALKVLHQLMPSLDQVDAPPEEKEEPNES